MVFRPGLWTSSTPSAGSWLRLDPGEDPGHARGTMSLGWPGNASRKSWWKWPGRGKSGPPCLGCCPRNPTPGQAADNDDNELQLSRRRKHCGRYCWGCVSGHLGLLVEEFMPVPTKQDWRDIAAGFLQRWNFPPAWAPSMASTLSSRPLTTQGHCTTTIRGHSPSSSFQLWTPTTCSGSSMSVAMDGTVTVGPWGTMRLVRP